MRAFVSQRLMSLIPRSPRLWLFLLSLLSGLQTTQAATSPVAFDLVIYGNGNTPVVELYNKSRLRITRFELTIGNYDKSFDYAWGFWGNHGTPVTVTTPDQGDNGVWSDTIDLSFGNGGIPSGRYVAFETDIDDNSSGNGGLDYRNTLFNNGEDRPNATAKVTLENGDTATIILPDGAADRWAYYFYSEARRRELRIESATEAGAPTKVGRVSVLIDGAPYTYTDGVALPVYDGERVEVKVPREVYYNLFGSDITDSLTSAPDEIEKNAQERFTALGISLDNVAPSGDPTYINFDVDGDARVVIKWQHEFALVVEHDFGRTASDEKDDAGRPWAGPLESRAEGNPLPQVKKNWVKKGETIVAQVDGQVLDLNRAGLDVRYIPVAYVAWGPPNGRANPQDDRAQIDLLQTPSSRTNQWTPRQVPPLRQQVPQFVMYGPGYIRYVWQIQYGVRVNVDDPTRAALAKVYGRSSSGAWIEIGNGEGTFWFDPNSAVRVVTAANANPDNSGLALRGWYNGDGYYFSVQAEVNSETGALESGGTTTLPNGSEVATWLPSPSGLNLTRPYRGMEIPQLRRAARVLWRYDRQAITVVARLGEFVFQDNPSLADQFISQPETIEQRNVTGSNRNVGNDQMAIWDPVASRLYPLVPGRFVAKWRPNPNRPETMDITVDARYPDRSHYPHIANTPPVNVDPDPADTFVFKEIKYTETDASVDGQKRFTATAPGKTVMLFTELQKDGRGVTREFMRVRVVETKSWETGLVEGSAIIGRKVSSLGFDQAQLGTGFVYDPREKARYNPFIYDAEKLNGLASRDIYDMAALRSDAASKKVINKDKLPGPIIPVNLFPGAARDEKLIVVWYDDPAVNDLLLWPHQAVVYNPRWPETPEEGLGQIIIASQFGSEGLDANGKDQEVVEAVNDDPAETTYNPSRLQQVQVYSQPDPTLPGYNPNEEHGLTAPSLRYADISPRPPAIYALRANDLNTFDPSLLEDDQDPATYTSHPRVLVQFYDAAVQEYRMRVYQVSGENDRYRFASQPLITSTRTDGTVDTAASTLNGQPHVDMEAGEPVIPFYPLGVAIGASPCAATTGSNLKSQLTYWEDHRGTSWSVSGGSNAWFIVRFHYPLAPDFWWPVGKPGYLRQEITPSGTVRKATIPQVGDCVAFYPVNIRNLTENTAPEAIVADASQTALNSNPVRVLYKSDWPKNVPVLKAGETLTFAGGEYRADNPFSTVNGEQVETEGLPGVVAFSSAEVVFDSQNPTGTLEGWKTSWTARVAQVLDVRSVPLSLANFPSELQPASKRSRVKGGKFIFDGLPSSLQRRLRYDPVGGRVEIIGLLNDKAIGDRTLTASPPAVYILEPNILTAEELEALTKLDDIVGSKWDEAVTDLYKLSRNPSMVTANSLLGSTSTPFFQAPPTNAVQRATWQTRLEQFWRHYYFGVLPADSFAADFLRTNSTVKGLSARDPVPTPISIDQAESGYLVGLEPRRVFDLDDKLVTVTELETAASPTNVPKNFPRPVLDPLQAVPLRAFGPGLALVPNGDYLRPSPQQRFPAYVAVVENNDPSLGGSPITVHIVKVDPDERYRGAIKTVASDNVFDENVVLRHTGDFGANADDLVFEWWYRFDDGSLNVPPPDRIPAGTTSPWKIFPDPSGKAGVGRFQMTLAGNPNVPEALLADSFWFVRYRHRQDKTEGANWKVRQDDGRPSVLFEWAGAGNSQPPDDYRAQLAQGWIKRVLDAVNPFEARIREFEGDNPSTVVSMISQFGQPYVGPVALNPDKNVIENVGLIELYETILKRGKDLSIDLSRPVSTPAIANALQLASTRISDFYTVLGHEAYTDAVDPTIGYGWDDLWGGLNPVEFCFKNQVSTLLEEELALLRGVDDFFARPVYNRLFWNFTKAEGEAAYAQNYNITDVNLDGFINEADAMILYPQGHGDAWGHYLTALRNQYDLLREPNFNWVSRSEFYNLQDVVLKVDFLDERKFAQVAAARAKAGAEIVSLTYRSAYVEDPNAQWQGYTDVDPDRGWGVQEWARRAGQAAYFDWVTANALLPSTHPNTTLEGIQKVDRQANADIAVISANLNTIQRTIDQANKGQNPLGVPRDGLIFDLDPTFLEVGSTAQIGTRAVQGLFHFDQIFERTLKMMENTVSVWDNANEADTMLRAIGNDEATRRNEVFQEDLTYRNELIRIFGKPYEGTIGPGKVYPAGYSGPDLLLYMYADVREVNADTVPGPTTSFASFNGNSLTTSDVYDAVANGVGSGKAPRGTLSDISKPDVVTLQGYLGNDVVKLFAPSFYPDSSGKVWAKSKDGLYGVNYTDLVNPKVPLEGLTQIMPVTAAGYTFQAPREWGARQASGELQQLISQMIQQEAQIASAIGAWDSLQGGIVRQIRFINAKLDMTANIRLKNEIFSRVKTITLSVLTAIEGVKEALDAAEETLTAFYEATTEAIPGNLLTAGLAVSPGDALAPVRAGLRVAGVGAATGIDAAARAIKITKVITESGLAIAENELDLFEKREIDALDAKEMLKELENLVGDEPIRRIEIFKEIQTLKELSDQYRALLDEGIRLIDERAAYNKRVAAGTQRLRYTDMTFRVARNQALQHYRSMFDLTARYAYLSAKAYDYETNYEPGDVGSPRDILQEIVRARTIGKLDGEPRAGAGGLAESLAKLRQNYEVVKGQLGIKVPQIEIGKMSLRTENYRILPKAVGDGTTEPEPAVQPNGFPSPGELADVLWAETLQKGMVDNLWDVPEFRQYCRPFNASGTAGGNPVREPGIILRFRTTVEPGKNFFGHPLSGGDHVYDPSSYATKIQSVGVWFSNYPGANVLTDLPATPRVYLIPVGTDIMSVPSSPDPGVVRVWKVLDQRIPAPLAATSSQLDSPNWIPLLDSLNGSLGEVRKYSMFRAFHDNAGSPDEEGINDQELVADTRLVARSIWNTQWLLIIPGRMLNANPDEGLKRFIENISDIKLVFRTYGLSGG